MLRLTTIKEIYFSPSMRCTVLRSNFTIRGNPVLAYLKAYKGQKLDLNQFYFAIHSTPFPFSFKVSKPTSVLDSMREGNGLLTLRALLINERKDSKLADNFILESKTFFLTFNN